MDTSSDIRRKALEEAAVEVCGYCRGLSRGSDPLPLKTSSGYVHMFLHGNGSNPCASEKIWVMVEAEKVKREMLRRAARSK